MEGLKPRKMDDDGMLSVVDALVFLLSLLFVSLFFFHIYSASLSRTQDLDMRDIQDEMALNIHNHVIHHEIEETGYTNETSGERHTYRNITVERAIKNAVYLQYQEDNTIHSYDLDELQDSIKEVYELAAFNISHYHFAVHTDYEDSTFFISDILESDENLPDMRSSSVHVTTLGRDRVERIRIILYIWR